MDSLDRDEIYHDDGDDELQLERDHISLRGGDTFDLRAFLDAVEQTVIREIVRRRDR